MLLIAAFKRDEAMSVLYPAYASTLIWAAIIARMAFSDPIRPINMAGMPLIVGTFLMGAGKQP